MPVPPYCKGETRERWKVYAYIGEMMARRLFACDDVRLVMLMMAMILC